MRSGPGEARTLLLVHIISARPSKQPLMVRTFLKVYMELGSYFLFLQEQIKDIIITGKGSSGGGRRGWCEEWHHHQRMFAPDLSFQPKGLAERVGRCILAGRARALR